MPKLKINEDLCAVFNQSSIKDHAKKKDMWGGSFEPSPHDEFIYDDESKMFEYKQIVYADSLYKNFDEVLVNVVDVRIKNITKPKKYRVTECVINFTKDGYISIFNNGQGIPVDVVKDIKGNPVYIPQLISTEFLAGSNNADNSERITGGVNGIGLSMVFNNSSHTVLETMDIDRKKHYIQETHNRLDAIDAPIISSQRAISPENVHKRGGTTIKFKPSYDVYKFDLKKDYETLNSLFKTRAIQVAAHMNIDVVYNGVKILPNKNKIKDFASMFMRDFVYVNIKHDKYPWDVIIGTSTDKFQSLSIINGVCVKTGNHINYIKDQVIDAIKPKAEKLVKKYREYKKSMLQNHMFVIISGNIPNPSFDSQTKTNISGGIGKYKKYVIKPSDTNKVWKMLEPILIEEYTTTKTKKRKKASTSGIKKYKPAKYAGKKECTLLVCEGDSAESMTKTALISKDTKLNYDYFGTFNIGGVPINARTKSKPYKKKNGDIGYRREKMLVENERWSSFEIVMNLNHDFTYDTQEELKTLSYQHVVMNVDQDLDGVGQICGLVMSNIHRFWPSLIQKGVVKRFETPIKRAYPKGKGNVLSFYTDDEYRKWEEKKSTDVDKYEIKYYKGLATHNDDEAIHMFKHYENHLYVFTLDDAANATFDIYYGNDPGLRKKELIQPLDTSLLNAVGKNMPSSVHLKTHTKEFQLDNIMRKLPNVFDGLNPARRKALCASRKRFLHNNKEVKVFQLGGFVAEKMNYHHGAASLESTLINMAQDFVGANNYPLLLPLSQFGSRYSGGKDAGASRYIKTKLNKDFVSAMFKSDDDYIINYTTDEGVVNEPIHYIPIAPFVLMESLELPASGWKYCGYARSWDSIYKNIVSLINNMDEEGNVDISLIKQMPFNAMGWNGSVRSVKSKSGISDWSVGKYKYNQKTNTIEISELPYRTWNNTFEESLENKELIANTDDKSSKLQINIKIKLKTNGIEKMEQICKNGPAEFDIIEDYIGLKNKLDQNLNMIKHGNVKEYNDYESVLCDWFSERYIAYKKRFTRLAIIIKLRIELLLEVIRFVNERKKYNFSVCTEEQADKLMDKNGFIRFDKVLLDNPKFTPVDKIEYFTKGIDAPNSSYNYLYSITPKQQMEAARNARHKKLKELQDYYKHITGPNIIKTTWIDELKELNSVIEKAKSSDRGWLYNESKARFA